MKKLNETELRALIFHSINHYFYDGHDSDDGGGIELNLVGKSFNIAFTEEGGDCYAYTVEATAEAVTAFIDELFDLRNNLKFSASC
jgi:hypothetical protein